MVPSAVRSGPEGGWNIVGGGAVWIRMYNKHAVSDQVWVRIRKEPSVKHGNFESKGHSSL